MAPESVQRRLTAILSTDVVGFSRLMGTDEAGTLAALKSHRRELIDPAIEKHEGRLVKLMGDGALAEFPSIVEATKCAVAIQRGMAARNAETPADRRIEFRIGINLGDIIVEGDDIYGDGVNVAARLEGLADPGGICISESVRTAVGTKLPLAYAFLGEREVKNIAEPVRAYRVVLGGEAPTDDVDTPPPCPYPGMVPYRAEDARFFYGRDDEIRRMAQLLRHQRFLMVIGPSGSGKSSLVYAGLVPELGTSKYFDDGFWLVRQMRPGPRPMETLARLLEVAGEAPQFAHDTVQTVLAAHPPAQRLLLLVDQFEETFTQADRDQRTRFIAALQGLRTPENCALLLTLRADFYPDLMTSLLWPIDASQRVEVAPLRGEALRTALQQPAADVGVRLEESLLSRLLSDAADEPGALPLLQETIGLLWQEMEHRVLPYHAYERLSSDWSGAGGEAPASGLAVAIAMKADATLAALAPAEQVIARRIFLRLIQFGEGRADTRRQQALSALRAAGDEPGAFDRTLEHLTDNRLVTRSGGDEHNPPTVDISHESLIAGWSRLQDWADERREAEQIRRRLEGKAAEWVRLGKGIGGLLDEAELPEAERWLASDDAADLGFHETLPELVQASQRAIEEAEQAREAARAQELRQAEALAEEQRQRIAEQSRAAENQARAAGRMRRALVGLAAVFLVAVGAGVFAWIQGQKAQTLAEQEAVARQAAESRRVEAQNARLASIAQLLSIRAPQQQAARLDELGALMARQAHLFATNGSLRLKAQVDRVLRTAASKPYFSQILRQEISAGVAVSHDGTRLAAASLDQGAVHLWDLTRPGDPPVVLAGGWPGDLIPGSSAPAAHIFALAFSPDDATLLAANADGTIGRWDLENPEAPFDELPRQAGGVWSAAFSPDGRWLALGSRDDDSFALLDLEAPDAAPKRISDPQPAPARHALPVQQPGGVPVAFSPDGTLLATGGMSGRVRLWHPGNLAEPIATLRGHDGPMLALDFHPDGKRLVSGGEDATIRLWNIERPSDAHVVVAGEFGLARSLDFAPDGRTLVSAVGSGVNLWRVDRLDEPPVVVSDGWVYKARFTPDGRQLVTGGNGQTYLRLWQLEPSGRPRVFPSQEGTVLSIAFSPDMKLLASGDGESQDGGGIRLWRWDRIDVPPRVLRGHEGDVNSLQFSADGKRLLSASWNDDTVRLWDLEEPTPVSTVLPPPDDTLEPWTAIFTSGDSRVLTSGVAGVYAWSLGAPPANPTLLAPTPNWVTEIDVSPDGGTLAMVGWFPDVQLLNLESVAAPAKTLAGHERDVWSVDFSPDGKTLASGGRKDGTIRLWKPGVPDAAATMLGRHDEAVTRVRFSPDGKQLASVSMDHTVQLWDFENPTAVPIVLDGQSPLLSLAYSPDGKHLVAGSRDRTMKIWDLSHPMNTSTAQQVADMICRKVRRNLTLDEWHTFIGTELPYERTCPNLPLHPSLIGTAEKLAKAGDVAAAVALFQRAVTLDPDLDLDPQAEASRLASSGE